MGPTLETNPDQNVPSPGIESPAESELFDPDIDIANTHANNDELRDTRATRDCLDLFSSFESPESFKDAEIRERLGSIPTIWCNEAIPLFNHDDNDYQLHFSYTWMEAIHTFTYTGEPNPGTADWYVHCLAGLTKQRDMQFVTTPKFIIPLGKLFMNKSGQSRWTGYEIFVSERLEVWVVYVPNEHHIMRWNAVDAGFAAAGHITNPHQHGPPQLDTKAISPTAASASQPKLARLCPQLKDLASATFEKVQPLTRSSDDKVITDHFYLLEILIGYGPSSFEKFFQNGPRYLISESNSYSSDTLASRQVLLLAKENANDTFIKLSPDPLNDKDRRRDMYFREYSLLFRGTIFNSPRIVEMILGSGNVDAYAREKDFSDVSMLYLANQFGMEALVKLILTRINPDPTQEQKTTLFIQAIKRHGGELVKLLLETGKFDPHRIDQHSRIPLVIAGDRATLVRKHQNDEDFAERRRNWLAHEGGWWWRWWCFNEENEEAKPEWARESEEVLRLLERHGKVHSSRGLE
ncbi:hypothetical protein F5X98DRAFT_375862 [Xylaria grammica]|nr:hypothetical protein F5X98DRAFT_375862 [Xylaria grammica]